MSFRKLDGTICTSFQIGGSHGPTIYQGSGAPSGGLGANGDLYIASGVPAFYGKVNGAWVRIVNDTSPLVRTTLVRGSPLTVSGSTTLVAVLLYPYTTDSTAYTTDSTALTMDKDANSTTAVTLPTGSEGQAIIVKDESGLASTYAINIIPPSGTIDGASQQTIAVTEGFMELLYTGGTWVVVGR